MSSSFFPSFNQPAIYKRRSQASGLLRYHQTHHFNGDGPYKNTSPLLCTAHDHGRLGTTKFFPQPVQLSPLLANASTVAFKASEERYSPILAENETQEDDNDAKVGRTSS